MAPKWVGIVRGVLFAERGTKGMDVRVADNYEDAFKATEFANMPGQCDAEGEDTSEIFSMRTIVQAWQDDEEREKREREEKREALRQQEAI